jgi:ABC-type dipeptide/oligopeptide/nickel transport system ATPase component
MADPEACMKKYPFELSGGMRQRIAIAIAIACSPELLVADEATTAQDSTKQALIVKHLCMIRETRGTSIIFITHDLAVAATFCDRIAVMDKGRFVEVAPTRLLLESPIHPFTKHLVLQARSVSLCKRGADG